MSKCYPLFYVFHLIKMYRLKSLLLFFFVTILICPNTGAQTHMRIHHKGGDHSDVAIEQIDSITFVDRDVGLVEEVELAGSWLWGDKEAGYYELLTFNDDNTYTGYVNYFSYGFDTMTYGWFFRYGNLLTLQSNGFGYNRKYTWFVMGLSENALDVMTKIGQFTYYRLRSETITLNGGDSLACEDGDSFVFADGVVARITGKELVGLSKGTTYVQKQMSNTHVLSYKVIVE